MPVLGVGGLDDTFERPFVLGRLARYGAATASLAAAAVHASAIAGHAFGWLHLMAFVAMTVFQAWWAYLVLRSSSARVLLAGVVGHGAIVTLWLVSRTVGIPEPLPGHHVAEAVGLKDAAATALAVMALACIDVVSRRDLARRLVRPSVAGAAASAFVLAVALLAVPATLTEGHVHDRAPQAGAHPH